ncbi:unnamed protein product, partial [Meganyctiphanes norvegica]
DEIGLWNSQMSARFLSRSSILKNACDSHKGDPSLHLSQQFPRLRVLSYAKGILVCRIAKVGSTTWSRILGDIPDGRDITHEEAVILRTSITDKAKREYLLASSDYNTKSSDFSSLPPVVRVITVRHPLERLLSAYKDKFNGGHNFTVGGRRKHYHLPLLHLNNISYHLGDNMTVSFTQFIDYAIRTDNAHWRTYDDACSPCHLVYDFITHLDTFAEDLRYIYQKMGISVQNDSIFHTQARNSGLRVGEEDPSYDYYFKTLTRNQLKKIYQTYKKDFVLFGFELPKYLKEFENNTTTELISDL